MYRDWQDSKLVKETVKTLKWYGMKYLVNLKGKKHVRKTIKIINTNPS